ncbi:pilus assembly protein TadG-related protein [Micromonospora sp. WMMD1082]|uniref:pilus assembly protein TadG-related protein n=1 Tax=Micromonospora sp. WMMD1082 TaxID=3016104 RepID=UPI00241714AD|nr:pilus assembly protein TadG-related protein [Micromonospora sp. WMMD1082]MDG4795012.1 pilus assembly protein TadG-related protein [Micromonospora sp. WMMD1082]
MTPWTVVGVVIVLVLAGLVLDLGAAMADKVRLRDIAQAAARAGAREIDLAAYRATAAIGLHPARAAAAARAFAAQTGVDGQITATASTTTVTVTITGTRQTQLLHLVGITGLPVSATATATPLTGVTAPD